MGVDVLNPFMMTQVHLEGEKYVTESLTIPMIEQLRVGLQEFESALGRDDRRNLGRDDRRLSTDRQVQGRDSHVGTHQNKFYSLHVILV